MWKSIVGLKAQEKNVSQNSSFFDKMHQKYAWCDSIQLYVSKSSRSFDILQIDSIWYFDVSESMCGQTAQKKN